MSTEPQDFLTRLRMTVAILGKQNEVADRIGVSQARLSNYMRGVNEPPAAVLERLAAESGVALEWLTAGRGEVFSRGPAGAAKPERLSDGTVIDLVRRRAKEDPELGRILGQVIATVLGDEAGPAGAAAGETAGGPPSGRAEPEPHAFDYVRPVEGESLIPASDLDELKADQRERCTPLVGVASAGLAFTWDPADFPPREARQYVRIRGEAPGGFAMVIEGDSMAPELPNRCIALFGARTTADERSGKPALVVYRDDHGRLRYAVKIVSQAGRRLRLRPINERLYAEVQVDAGRVEALYTVIGPVMLGDRFLTGTLPHPRDL